MKTEEQAMLRQYSRHTGVGIAGKVGAPLDIGAPSMLASSDSVAADGAQDRREADLWAGGDDAVGDHVVDGLGGSVRKRR